MTGPGFPTDESDDMTLVEAFRVMKEAGYTQALDRYSRFARPILDWMEEARNDLGDWTARPDKGLIEQNTPRPTNDFRCTRNL